MQNDGANRWLVNLQVQVGTMLVPAPVAAARTFINTSDFGVAAVFPQNVHDRVDCVIRARTGTWLGSHGAGMRLRWPVTANVKSLIFISLPLGIPCPRVSAIGIALTPLTSWVTLTIDLHNDNALSEQC
jgi:hypothetical protein